MREYDYHDLMIADSTHKDYILTDGYVEPDGEGWYTVSDYSILITNSDLIEESFTYKQMLFSEEQMTLGSVVSDCIEFSCHSANGRISPDGGGARFDWYVILDGDIDTLGYLGRFDAESEEYDAESGISKFTAYNPMGWISKENVSSWYNEFFEERANPVLSELIDSFFDDELYMSYSIVGDEMPNANMPITKTMQSETTTGAIILHAIAEAMGCVVRIDYDAMGIETVKFTPLVNLFYSEPPTVENDYIGVPLEPYELGVDKVLSLKPGAYSYGYGSLIMRTSDEDIGTDIYWEGNTEDTDSNMHVITGNAFLLGKTSGELEEYGTPILNNIAQCGYRMFEAECVGNPFVEVGDKVYISTMRGDEEIGVESIITERTMTGIQHIVDKYSAAGTEVWDEQLNNEYASLTMLAGKITQIQANTDGIVARVSDLEADMESIVTQTIGEIDIRVQGGMASGEGASAHASITIALKDGVGQVMVESDEVEITGAVSFHNLETAGETTINGSNIQTGRIESTNYQPIAVEDLNDPSAEFCASGMAIDLDNGEIQTENFCVKSDGTVKMQAGYIGDSEIVDSEGLAALKHVNDAWKLRSAVISGNERYYTSLTKAANLVVSNSQLDPHSTENDKTGLCNVGSYNYPWNGGYFKDVRANNVSIVPKYVDITIEQSEWSSESAGGTVYVYTRNVPGLNRTANVSIGLNADSNSEARKVMISCPVCFMSGHNLTIASRYMPSGDITLRIYISIAQAPAQVSGRPEITKVQTCFSMLALSWEWGKIWYKSVPIDNSLFSFSKDTVNVGWSDNSFTYVGETQHNDGNNDDPIQFLHSPQGSYSDMPEIIRGHEWMPIDIESEYVDMSGTAQTASADTVYMPSMYDSSFSSWQDLIEHYGYIGDYSTIWDVSDYCTLIDAVVSHPTSNVYNIDAYMFPFASVDKDVFTAKILSDMMHSENEASDEMIKIAIIDDPVVADPQCYKISSLGIPLDEFVAQYSEMESGLFSASSAVRTNINVNVNQDDVPRGTTVYICWAYYDSESHQTVYATPGVMGFEHEVDDRGQIYDRFMPRCIPIVIPST